MTFSNVVFRKAYAHQYNVVSLAYSRLLEGGDNHIHLGQILCLIGIAGRDGLSLIRFAGLVDYFFRLFARKQCEK